MTSAFVSQPITKAFENFESVSFHELSHMKCSVSVTELLLPWFTQEMFNTISLDVLTMITAHLDSGSVPACFRHAVL